MCGKKIATRGLENDLSILSLQNMRKLTHDVVPKGSVDEIVPSEPKTMEELRSAQEECIASVFLGIKTIIQSRIDEIQSKFQDQFYSLEHEVRQRDDIISLLQQRIQELEQNNGTDSSSLFDNNRTGQQFADQLLSWDQSTPTNVNYTQLSPDPSATHRPRLPSRTSFLFGRGDSIDTVISNQDYEDDVFEREERPFDDMGNIATHVRRRSSISSDGGWSQHAQKEMVEMQELTPEPWQLEFHRDRDSLPPPNGSKGLTTLGLGGDVAVEIGVSSSEDSSASSVEENEQVPTSQAAADSEAIQLVPEQVPLSSSEEEHEVSKVPKEEEEDDDDDEDDDESSDSPEELDNRNWEVQMLAQEMERREEKKQDEQKALKFRELEEEISEMQSVVSQGSLSPSELDMIESLLESKCQQVTALYKAYSVEACEPAHAALGTQKGKRLSFRKKAGRSCDEGGGRFRRSSLTLGHAAQIPEFMSGSSGAGAVGTTSGGTRVHAGAPRLSPGEHKDLQELIFARKRSVVQRQTSLCESGVPGGTMGSNTRRRESAGAIISSKLTQSKTAILSKFSLVKQLTTGGGSKSQLKGFQEVDHRHLEQHSAETFEMENRSELEPKGTAASSSASSSIRRKLSSATKTLPFFTSSPISSSSTTDAPGKKDFETCVTTQSSGSGLSAEVPSSSSSSHQPYLPSGSSSTEQQQQLAGESQPLLKK